MATRKGAWVRELRQEEKALIAARCDRFIIEVLKPRFMSHARITEFNYPIDIFGKWRGSKYSFIQRYRSGFRETLGEESDHPFTRLDHRQDGVAETRFDVMWHRHTGQWYRLFERV